jgi:hypothetical protein
MAIIAAVAMTQLLGKPIRRLSLDEKKNVEKKPEVPTVVSSPEVPAVASSPEVPAVASSPENGSADAPPAPKKQKLNSEEVSPDQRLVYSRNPSPVSVVASQSYMPHRVMPPHHHFHRIRHHHHHRRQLNPFPYKYYASASPKASPTYEDVTKSSGLPKSLSFRKICSKCGKTRGEHGELGFGNKCLYQECGKCGAGVEMHLKAGSPMGILCRLTVEEGAIPGAATKYKRKIRDLAARAELQKSLLEDKRERAERLAQILP